MKKFGDPLNKFKSWSGFFFGMSIVFWLGNKGSIATLTALKGMKHNQAERTDQWQIQVEKLNKSLLQFSVNLILIKTTNS